MPPRLTNQIWRPIASTISGVTRIRKTSARNTFVQTPGRRASAIPASPPSTTEISVATIATLIEFASAFFSSWLSSNRVYQWVVNPPQRVKSRLSVNEWITTKLIGRKRKM